MHNLSDLLTQRTSVSKYDPTYKLSPEVLEELVAIAATAPSAFNLQNWHFTAVTSEAAKQKLYQATYEQPQILEASAIFIVSGEQEAYKDAERRLGLSVQANIIPASIQKGWSAAALELHQENPQLRRDEAIRSASLSAMLLMIGAQAMGLQTGAMGGFDPEAVHREFGLAADAIPVMLVTVGKAREGNWSQKVRRPVAEILSVH